MILFGLTITLSGCFISGKPLFAPENAELPLADGTVLTAFALDEQGHRKDETPTRFVAKRKEHSYVFTPDGDAPLRAMFDDIGNDYFVAAELGIEADVGPQYGLVHKVGESWFVYMVTCSSFEDLIEGHKTLADFHITKSGSQCRFGAYDDVKNALMFLASRSKPTTEFVVIK
tara:strand:+ start:78 stop:596 length:519 start_codon:yes stop_codon:yes gene_type:complete